MSNNDINLDINDYSYDELLNIYQLPDFYHASNLHTIQEKLKVVKENFDNQIYIFYLRVSKIIITVYELLNLGFLSNLKNILTIHKFVDKIKEIDSFEKYKTEYLVQKITKIVGSRQSILQDKNAVSDEVNSITQNLEIVNKADNAIPRNKLDLPYNEYNSLQNPIAPGALNSVKRVVQLINLNLNSCFRSNYYTSNPCDFQYQIPTEIKNVVSMRLASIEIPNAWYLFSHLKKNNAFTIRIKLLTVEESFQITLPDGNFDFETLQNYLNTTYFFESETTTFLKYIKFSIEPYNFKTKIEFTTIHPEGMSFSLVFMEEANQNLMNTLGWILGFRLANYLNITDCVQSEGLFDAGGDRYIYMSITDYQYNNNISNIVGFDKSILNEDIIAKIPLVNGKLSLIIDDNTNPLTKTRKYNGPVNLSRFHVKILDKFGRLVDFNNMDYSFTLELELLYESFNFSNVFA
jgi:hypothetical protein